MEIYLPANNEKLVAHSAHTTHLMHHVMLCIDPDVNNYLNSCIVAFSAYQSHATNNKYNWYCSCGRHDSGLVSGSHYINDGDYHLC